MYYLMKKFPEAKQCFATVTKLEPKFEAAFFNLGLTNKALNATGESLAAFKSATAIKKDYTKAYIEIARLLDRKGDVDGSISNYKTALGIEPGNVSALREIAAEYSKAGKFADAERYFREALTLGSDDAQTNYNMATVQLELG
jgi:tetratricopeptide (TPR) repeat protein